MKPAHARTRGPLGWSLGLSLGLHVYALVALEVEPGVAVRTPQAPQAALQARLVPPAARLGAPPEVLKNTLDPPHAKPLADPIEPKRRVQRTRKPKSAAATAPPIARSPGERASAPPERRGLDLRLPPPERSGAGLRPRAAEQLPPEALRETLGRLSEEMLYPPEALRRGLEGEVVVLVELGETGRILDASIASGSGHPELDAAALRAVRKVGTLGPSSANKTILLPVRFRIM
ncbi:MAG: TonB family protein [Burkholderiales bacterium]|nr:TonB family protein [Burkholderiales bacterium]